MSGFSKVLTDSISPTTIPYAITNKIFERLYIKVLADSRKGTEFSNLSCPIEGGDLGRPLKNIMSKMKTTVFTIDSAMEIWYNTFPTSSSPDEEHWKNKGGTINPAARPISIPITPILQAVLT
uniref:Uncharacterized protein n=1 Tax=Photinus pyralis TaxID=7054 RepID=A0A1Y1M040_PHOPY